ncbi:RNA ligase 1 isoform X3 [Melanerpes formicivorus]|uniref:RNA ligase 1 isoform X3 n=1 Tax=Melanerpes formicivorus TaxID=211600 RepID=UPI00358EEDA2
MSRRGAVQRKLPCLFVTEVKEEPSAKRERQVPPGAAGGLRGRQGGSWRRRPGPAARRGAAEGGEVLLRILSGQGLPRAALGAQPFKVLATETLSGKALEADLGSATPTEKVDGTCCYVTAYKGRPCLWARLDRRPCKQAERRFRSALCALDSCREFTWNVAEDFKPVPDSWIPAKDIEFSNGSPLPDENGHMPGLGSKKQPIHLLVPHGAFEIQNPPALKHKAILSWFEGCSEGKVEGIVWHCQDGSLIKLHRHHLGLRWPLAEPRLSSQPVLISFHTPQHHLHLEPKSLFHHFAKLDGHRFDRLQDIKFDA